MRRYCRTIPFVASLLVAACGDGDDKHGGPPEPPPDGGVPTYQVVVLSDLGMDLVDGPYCGPGESRGRYLNDAGQVIGRLRATGVAVIYQRGQLTTLGPLDRQYQLCWLNDAGQVAGTFRGPEGLASQRGFVYANGAVRLLGTLNGLPTTAWAVGEAGHVIGASVERVGPPASTEVLRNGFVDQQGQVRDLGESTIPYAVNGRGDITGARTIGVQDDLFGDRAFLWRSGATGEFTLLPCPATNPEHCVSRGLALNEAGQVAGHATAANGRLHAFLFADGVSRDLGTLGGTGEAGFEESEAYDVNESGQVTGWALGPGGRRAFVYSSGAMYDLGTLGGTTQPLSVGLRINDDGVIAGESQGWNNYLQVFVYQSGVMTDVTALLGLQDPAVDQRGSELFGLNEAGEIAVLTYGPDSRSYLLTPMKTALDRLANDVAALAVPGLGWPLALAMTYYESSDRQAACAQLADFDSQLARHGPGRISGPAARTLRTQVLGIEQSLRCD